MTAAVKAQKTFLDTHASKYTGGNDEKDIQLRKDLGPLYQNRLDRCKKHTKAQLHPPADAPVRVMLAAKNARAEEEACKAGVRDQYITDAKGTANPAVRKAHEDQVLQTKEAHAAALKAANTAHSDLDYRQKIALEKTARDKKGEIGTWQSAQNSAKTEMAAAKSAWNVAHWAMTEARIAETKARNAVPPLEQTVRDKLKVYYEKKATYDSVTNHLRDMNQGATDAEAARVSYKASAHESLHDETARRDSEKVKLVQAKWRARAQARVATQEEAHRQAEAIRNLLI
jgi:hypothetical protein